MAFSSISILFANSHWYSALEQLALLTLDIIWLLCTNQTILTWFYLTHNFIFDCNCVFGRLNIVFISLSFFLFIWTVGDPIMNQIPNNRNKQKNWYRTHRMLLHRMLLHRMYPISSKIHSKIIVMRIHSISKIHSMMLKVKNHTNLITSHFDTILFYSFNYLYRTQSHCYHTSRSFPKQQHQ